MKSKILIFCLIQVAVWSNVFNDFDILAKPINVDIAQTIGEKFLGQNIVKTKVGNRFQSVEPAYYIFNSDSGFVIVAADDIVSPILGYSYNSATGNDGPLPDNMKWWLDKKAEQINDAIRNNVVATIEVATAWQNLLSDKHSKKERFMAGGVEPLIKTKWNQSPYYNDLTPGNSPTGCVATAMAQVMNYWQWPKTGTDNHCYTAKNYQQELYADFANTTYQWDKMPDSLTENSTDAEISAVATLMFHCGVAVEMGYSEGSSRAPFWVYQRRITNGDTIVSLNPPGALPALNNYFKYKPTKGYYREQDTYDWDTGEWGTLVLFTTEEWSNILKTEIDAKRPVLYAGGAHAFICDGYDDNNNFHFNWGWGGMYDGYFDINELSPGPGGVGAGSGEYNDGEHIIAGIESPTGLPTSVEEKIVISNFTLSPNPTSGMTDLIIDVQYAGKLHISLNNQLGQELLELHNDFIEDGQFVKTFSLEAFPIGVYYLKIILNDNVEIKKIIKN